MTNVSINSIGFFTIVITYFIGWVLFLIYFQLYTEQKIITNKYKELLRDLIRDLIRDLSLYAVEEKGGNKNVKKRK